MVARTPSDVLGASPILRAALVAGPRPAQVPGLLAELRDLAGQDAALALRLGMVLASIRSFDLAELGYSGFQAFCRERVDWGSSWVRAIVRLVESPLDDVKAAAAAGRVPLRVAVTAPGRVQVHQQAEWLAGGAAEAPSPVGPRSSFHADDAEIVAEARELAQVCLGGEAPITRVDAYILRHWRERVPGKAIEEGRTPPPAPDPRKPDFRWAGGAPAEALLGPWVPPADLAEAIEQLDAVQTARRRRLSELARGFVLVHFEAHWIAAGYASPWDYAQQELGWSRRTAQRYRKLGWALEWYPQLEAAVRAGFSPEAARQIGWFAQDDAGCARLIDLARHLGPRDLRQALANGGERLGEYERALALARRHAATLLGPDGPTTRPSGTSPGFHVGSPGATLQGFGDGTRSGAGGGAATPAGVEALGAGGRVPAGDVEAQEHRGVGGGDASGAGGDVDARGDQLGASGAGAPSHGEVALRIALVPAPPARPARLRGHPDLPEAARWFVANNAPPRPTGFAACKERARHRCGNPECGRATWLTEAHHIHWRRHGGSDDPDNAVPLCPSCHLRNVHTSAERIRVTRVVLEGLEARLWEYPGRPPILQFRDVPPRPPDGAGRVGSAP